MLSVIGLMSGTSADSIDAALIKTDGTKISRNGHTLSYPFSATTRNKIDEARANPTCYLSSPDACQSLARAITIEHNQAITALLDKVGVIDTQLIGFHGQTIFHDPKNRQSLQLGDGRLLAKLTNLPVIYDFRRADLQAGGQGAPLAPIYHQILAREAALDGTNVFINIGGITNLTFIDGEILLGYDIGPGNALIDDLSRQHFDLPFDEDGRISATGQADKNIIKQIMADPFFSLTGPRSLDRGYFHHYLSLPAFCKLKPADQIASVTALTAEVIIHAIHQLPSWPDHLIICGGGGHNHSGGGGKIARISAKGNRAAAR